MPGNFEGLRVVAFESRRADDMTRLLERFGATALVSPSMRELPLEERGAVVDYVQKLAAGDFDLVILMTGVGLRQLASAVEHVMPLDDLKAAYDRATTLARGPKPVSVLREWGLKPNYTVPEPNTWRELLETIDSAGIEIRGKRVALQEYGRTNEQLVAGLKERGAEVETIRIYRWALPEDLGPMEENIRRLAEGQADVVMFTSSPQVLHVDEVAERMGLVDALHQGLQSVVVASIGPTCSDTLREQGWPVDMEPEHPKMGHLVSEGSERAAALLADKRGKIG
jgi:uroporphyrinogen-III synthase